MKNIHVKFRQEIAKKKMKADRTEARRRKKNIRKNEE